MFHPRGVNRVYRRLIQIPAQIQAGDPGARGRPGWFDVHSHLGLSPYAACALFAAFGRTP